MTESTDPNTGSNGSTGETTYDVIVIGGGPVGENVAARAVRGKLTAALVESELLGGECSYWACMPSKALLRSSAALRAARAVPGAAEAATGDLDTAAVLARRDRFAGNWNDSGQVTWATGAGITVIRGHGALVGPRRVEVTGPSGESTVLTARHAVVICTGSLTALPPIDGLTDSAPWTNRDATSAKEPPRRLAILGGGVVGCELARAWSDLSSSVTVLEQTDRLLGTFEPFAGELVGAAMRSDGIDVRLGTAVTTVSREPADAGGSDHGPVRVTMADGESVVVDALLVATGRRPATSDIGLSTVGLTDGAWLEVDDSGRVTAVDDGWLYAAGDVTGQALLTHMGKYAARATGDAISARARGEHAAPTAWSPFAATALHDAVCSVVFTDPEVAAVGRTEEQASEGGLPVRAVELDIDVAGASLQADGYTGRCKLVVDQSRQVVVGFTAVGPGVGELLHAATIAVVGEVPLDRLWHAVPSYPTVSELWLRLLEAYGL